MRSREIPPIDWRAVALGLLLAVAIVFLGGGLGVRAAPMFGVAATLFGIAAGAFLAGKRAERAPLYQAVSVGAGYIVLEAIGLVPGPLGPGEGALADTLAIVAGDLILLAVAAGAGWLAAVSFSSGTGRAR